MKKLLSIFSAMIVLNSSSVAVLNNNEPTNKIINHMETYSSNESLLKYKFKTVVISDFNGIELDNIVDEVFAKAIENNPEYEDFIIYVSEHPNQFEITGNDFAIPGVNESVTYKLKIRANSSNELYTSLTSIEVVLTNKKPINIAEYEILFSTKIKQLFLEAIGHANDPNIWTKEMLLELDKQLIESGANMHGFDGKDGITLFTHAFDKKLIEIDFGQPIHNYFSEEYEHTKIKVKSAENTGNYLLESNKVLNVKVNVKVNEFIDISDSSFAIYFKDPIVFSIKWDSNIDQWKKEVFYRVDKRLESLEEKMNKQNLFTRNIEHLTFNHSNKNSWDDEYELYELEISTPSFVQDDILENRTLKIEAKVNRTYNDVSQEINYIYGERISAKWSAYIEDSDEKHYVVYSLEDKFKNIHDFQKKYKTIKVYLDASYNSDWPLNGSVGKGSYFKYFTKNLSDEASVSWIKLIDVNEEWGAMKVLVYVAYKVYLQNNKVKVAVKLWQKIKIDGGSYYYVETFVNLPKVITSIA